MKRHKTLLSFFAIALAGATAASADCAADLAQLTGAGGGVAKDGSLAPLQSGAAAPTAAPTPDVSAAQTPQTPPADAEGIAKDGSQVPLEGAAQGGATEGQGADVAMSAQDAQAQSQGAATAAADAQGAGGATDGPDRTAALERAHAALAQGDEAGCLAAVEEARAL